MKDVVRAAWILSFATSWTASIGRKAQNRRFSHRQLVKQIPGTNVERIAFFSFSWRYWQFSSITCYWHLRRALSKSTFKKWHNYLLKTIYILDYFFNHDDDQSDFLFQFRQLTICRFFLANASLKGNIFQWVQELLSRWSSRARMVLPAYVPKVA